jgi:hypothetical protein
VHPRRVRGAEGLGALESAHGERQASATRPSPGPVCTTVPAMCWPRCPAPECNARAESWFARSFLPQFVLAESPELPPKVHVGLSMLGCPYVTTPERRLNDSVGTERTGPCSGAGPPARQKEPSQRRAQPTNPHHGDLISFVKCNMLLRAMIANPVLRLGRQRTTVNLAGLLRVVGHRAPNRLVARRTNPSASQGDRR